MDPNLLISLDDITMLRGTEKNQEVYFVFLGYDVTGKGAQGTLTDDNVNLVRFTPEEQVLNRWFYMGASPIIRVRKGVTHTFLGGYPIFFGKPRKVESFYFAVVESDRGARSVFSRLGKDKAAQGLLGQVVGALEKGRVSAAALRQAFGVLIKAVELVLIKDDVRYTDVLTFKTTDDYMAGRHEGLGNHRVRYSLDVELIFGG